MPTLLNEDHMLGASSVNGGLVSFEISNDPAETLRVLVLSGRNATYVDGSVIEDTSNKLNNTWKITKY